jgi:hypothetical protein
VQKKIENLVSRGMGLHEAMEYNIEGAFMGQHMLLIIDDLLF